MIGKKNKMVDATKNPFFAVVTAIQLDDGEFATDDNDAVENTWSVVLNVGAQDGVELRQKFIIFSLGQELFDPHSKDSLGRFEIVRGNGEVSHVQERMCTVRSTNFRMERPTYNSLAAALSKGSPDTEWIKTPQPFK